MGGIADAIWKLNAVLFADDTVLLIEKENDLKKLVNDLNIIYKRKVQS